jgi:hypothetical protein
LTKYSGRVRIPELVGNINIIRSDVARKKVDSEYRKPVHAAENSGVDVISVETELVTFRVKITIDAKTATSTDRIDIEGLLHQEGIATTRVFIPMPKNNYIHILQIQRKIVSGEHEVLVENGEVYLPRSMYLFFDREGKIVE